MKNIRSEAEHNKVVQLIDPSQIVLEDSTLDAWQKEAGNLKVSDSPEGRIIDTDFDLKTNFTPEIISKLLRADYHLDEIMFAFAQLDGMDINDVKNRMQEMSGSNVELQTILAEKTSYFYIQSLSGN